MTVYRVILLLWCLVLTVGCASNKPIISAPDINKRIASVKNVGVIVTGTAVYELNVGGSRDLNNEWTSEAEHNLAKVSIEQLRAAGYNARLLSRDDQTEPIARIFNDIPREQLSRYVYSARKLEGGASEKVDVLLSKEGLDVLVFVRAVDHVSSGGRNAARVAAAVLLGVGASSGVAHVEMALLDKTPALVYYSHKLEDGKDLRKEEDMAHLFSEITEELTQLRGVN